MNVTVTQVASLFHEFDSDTFANSESKGVRKPTKKKSRALLLATNSGTRLHVQKQIGLQREENMLNKYELDTNCKIIRRNDELYSFTLRDGLTIHGKIDGFVQDANIVIEHKCRVRGLLNRIPFHEKVQCYIYMKMTDSRTVHLIESFGEHYAVHKIEYEEQIWEKIKSIILSNFILNTE